MLDMGLMTEVRNNVMIAMVQNEWCWMTADAEVDRVLNQYSSHEDEIRAGCLYLPSVSCFSERWSEHLMERAVWLSSVCCKGGPRRH